MSDFEASLMRNATTGQAFFLYNLLSPRSDLLIYKTKGNQMQGKQILEKIITIILLLGHLVFLVRCNA